MPTVQTRALIAILLAVVVFTALTLLFPEADPTKVLPGFRDFYRAELLVEAPAKAHEARNWALFGEWHRNPSDNYQFWRIQSPLWVYPLAWAFKAFGVSYSVLRSISGGYAVLGFIGLLVVGRRGLPATTVAVLAWVFATNLFVSQVGRSGLLEVALNAGAVWMIYALFKADKHPGWLIVSQLLFTAAFFTKAGIVYMFPLLVAMNIWTFLQYRRAGQFPRLRWVPVATAVVLGIGAVLWVTQPEYLRVLSWNTSHLVAGGTSEHSVHSFARFDAYRLFQGWYLLFPGLGLLGLPAIAWLAVRVAADRGSNRWEALLLAWIGSCLLALLVSRIWTIRHASILLIPNYLVIAWALRQLWLVAKEAGARARGLRALVVSAVTVTLLIHVGHQVRHYEKLGYERLMVSRLVQRDLGDQDAVIIGRLAMPILLDSPYDVFYVKHGFNMEREQVRALKPTHLLRRPRDMIDEYIVGDVLPRRHRVNNYKFWSQPLRLESVGRRPRVVAPRRGAAE